MQVVIPNNASLRVIWDLVADTLLVGFGSFENWGQFEEAILIYLEGDSLIILHEGLTSLTAEERIIYSNTLNYIAVENDDFEWVPDHAVN